MSERAEPFVGKELTGRKFAVTDAMLDDYYGGLVLAPRDDGKVPTMLASDAENAFFGEIACSNHIGHLWMRQGWECFAVLNKGETYTATGRIRDIYPHRDRSVVYYEVEVRDAAGALAIRTHHHQSFLREKPATGQVLCRDLAGAGFSVYSLDFRLRPHWQAPVRRTGHHRRHSLRSVPGD